jgi:GT2 family glycosyltransferase
VSSASVIVPFAGDAAAGAALLERLGAIATRPGDEVIVVDNSPSPVLTGDGTARILRADREASSYYARNVGAAAASGEWLLFVDADCAPAPDLLERHRSAPLDERVGAVAGAIRDPDAGGTAISRYIAVRGWFDQAHAAAQGRWSFGRTANLFVRRAAFDAVGGFCEGIRSTGDTEFCWRLARAGWEIGYADGAAVVHHHRESLGGLVRLSARYAAGAAWVRRRHGEPDYVQEADRAALTKGARNVLRALVRLDLDGVRFRALDALLVGVRRIALRLPNAAAAPAVAPSALVLCADRFPVPGGPPVPPAARVEALGRPLTTLDPVAARAHSVGYREDDADLVRWRAAVALARRRPVRLARWLLRRRDGAPLPAAVRTLDAGAAAVRALDRGGERLAADLAALTGARRG